jgi:peptidoglycan DL-endopeptidase CwlO
VLTVVVDPASRVGTPGRSGPARPGGAARLLGGEGLSLRRDWRQIGAVVMLAVVLAGTVTTTVVAKAAAPAAPAVAAAGSCTATPAPSPIGRFKDVQLQNAATIIAVGREMGVPVRGHVVALATAMQESVLRNLDYGDRDSLGLFQQRPSMGWGTPAQVRDPRYAARKFYAWLLSIPGWQAMPVTVAAQKVQRSGFPDAYAKWEDEAAAIVAATPVTCTSPKGT